MLYNDLKRSFREIVKNKTFSAIHILGLSVGIASFILILEYTIYELSYEKFYKNADQIYRIRQDRYDKGVLSTTWGAGCAGIGPALKQEFPEVIDYARLNNVRGVLRINENIFREERMYAVNSAFLTMLPLEMVAVGDSTALDEPYTAVISESIAKKFFGNINVIGQTFRFNNDNVFRITGVFKDIPANTHLKFNILISFQTYIGWVGQAVDNAWYWDGFYTYIRLRDGTDLVSFTKKMNDFTDEKTRDLAEQLNQTAEYILQPLKSIHLHSDLMWEAEVNGDYITVYFMLLVAIIILIIAWVNYFNLSTIKAVFRSKEVAIRKISGALRLQLIKQFLIESFTINLFATIVAIIMVMVSLPFLRVLTQRELVINHAIIWPVFAGVIFAGPVISGLYPALIISSFKPITIFRGRLNGGSYGISLRKILVVFQFAASVTLISITMIVYDQLTYMNRQDLGVNIDKTLIINGPIVADSTYYLKLTAFKEELLKYPVIKSISASTAIPGNKIYWNAGGIRRISDDPTKSKQYRVIGVDFDFVDSYNLSLLNGRSFSREYSSDENSVLLNEAAIRLMGFNAPESAVGEEIIFWGNKYKIIGVLKNYHHESLKKDFDATIFRLTPGTRDFFSIKLDEKGKNNSYDFKAIQSTIDQIGKYWQQYFPGNPFDYFFLSDHFDKQYSSEKQFRTIFELFAGLAIFIACLGLFGLSWFLIIRRTKEIGIRKVNGASIANLLLIISSEYIKMVFVSIILAAPVSFLFAENWLKKYPFRVDFSWLLFALSGFIILLISALTLSFVTIKAANNNPAESLRYE